MAANDYNRIAFAQVSSSQLQQDPEQNDYIWGATGSEYELHKRGLGSEQREWLDWKPIAT
jgi:hypothetical protein